MEDKSEVSKSQHGFVENKPLQSSLTSAYDGVGGLVDRRESVDTRYLLTLVWMMTISHITFS